MVNKEYYLAALRRLREAIRRKRSDLWADNSWIFHHDNAPSHSSLIVTEFLAKTEKKNHCSATIFARFVSL